MMMLVPALVAALAVGEPRRISGKQFLEAFLTGFEVECKIAEAIHPNHYKKGFHSSGTVGTFGAAVALWWAGQSLMDVAPYIADARALRIVLLGGRTGAEVEGHDWEAILAALGWLRYDILLGRLANLIGIVLMIAALAWGASVVARQHARSGTS